MKSVGSIMRWVSGLVVSVVFIMKRLWFSAWTQCNIRPTAAVPSQLTLNGPTREPGVHYLESESKVTWHQEKLGHNSSWTLFSYLIVSSAVHLLPKSSWKLQNFHTEFEAEFAKNTSRPTLVEAGVKSWRHSHLVHNVINRMSHQRVQQEQRVSQEAHFASFQGVLATV